MNYVYSLAHAKKILDSIFLIYVFDVSAEAASTNSSRDDNTDGDVSDGNRSRIVISNKKRKGMS
jgi:hypothetical protein